MLKKLFIAGCIAVVVGLFAANIAMPRAEKQQALHAFLGGEALVLEVADTDRLRTKGLSGHAPLRQNEGMLFVFSEDDYYGFWMKDMLFPIDIIWLDREYRIVDKKEHAAPESYPQVFVPEEPARYVVELSAGFFAEHHLEVGNIMQIAKQNISFTK